MKWWGHWVCPSEQNRMCFVKVLSNALCRKPRQIHGTEKYNRNRHTKRDDLMDLGDNVKLLLLFSPFCFLFSISTPSLCLLLQKDPVSTDTRSRSSTKKDRIYWANSKADVQPLWSPCALVQRWLLCSKASESFHLHFPINKETCGLR